MYHHVLHHHHQVNYTQTTICSISVFLSFSLSFVRLQSRNHTIFNAMTYAASSYKDVMSHMISLLPLSTTRADRASDHIIDELSEITAVRRCLYVFVANSCVLILLLIVAKSRRLLLINAGSWFLSLRFTLVVFIYSFQIIHCLSITAWTARQLVGIVDDLRNY